MINKFINNRKTTLTATLTSGDTSLPVSSLTTDLIGVEVKSGARYILTLTDNLETNREIIYVTASAGGVTPTSYTILKAQEGTGDLTWPSGSKVEIRLTSGGLAKFTQSFSDTSTVLSYDNIPYLQELIYTAKQTSDNRPNSTFVNTGVIKIDSNTAVYYLAGGTTAASAPFWGGFGSPYDILFDGTAVAIGMPINSDGTLTSHGVTVGKNALSAGVRTLCIASSDAGGSGTQSLTLNDSAVSFAGQALAQESVAIGPSAISGGIKSLALGGVGKVRNGLFTDKIASKESKIWASALDSTHRRFDTNLESVIWSEPISFNGGTTWAATTPAKHGFVFKPTAGGTNQFVRKDNSYNNYTRLPGTTYTPGNTGASQPTWPTTENFTVSDGGGQWVCHPNVGHTMDLPENFLVTQIGIVIFSSTAITVQPFVSFGKTGNNTFYVANVQTTLLTGTDTVQLFTPLNSSLSNSLTVSVNTLATATEMLGQVFFKGFYCPKWF
jgi:hypothetical protein